MNSSRFAEAETTGYTLIEVLVAMMILALALTVLMRIFSTGLQSVHTSSDYAHAIALAEARLAAVGSSAAMTVGETHGTDDKFYWTRIIDEYPPTAPELIENLPVAAYQVSVVVEWPGTPRARRLNLSTIKLDRSAGSGE